MSFLEEYHAKLTEPTHWTCRRCKRRRKVQHMVFNGFCKNCVSCIPKLADVGDDYVNNNAYKWTDDEDELLREMSRNKASMEEVLKALPKRTEQAIKAHAFQIFLPAFKKNSTPRAPMKPGNSVWDDERLKELRTLRWVEGYKTKQLALHFCCTRNSVIGALNRNFHSDGTEKRYNEPRR